MKLSERIHQGYVARRRRRVLCRHLLDLLPGRGTVLDVGCGDGLLAAHLMRRRPALRIRGIEVLPREPTHIAVERFDGRTLPYAAASFDVVMCIDVLHHARQPLALLREARRVARRAIVLKDHTCAGWLAAPTLRFMDRLGNARHRVDLPYTYWTRQQWQAAFAQLDLGVAAWVSDVGLYPWPAAWVFDRSLHFLALLEVPSTAAASAACESRGFGRSSAA